RRSTRSSRRRPIRPRRSSCSSRPPACSSARSAIPRRRSRVIARSCSRRAPSQEAGRRRTGGRWRRAGRWWGTAGARATRRAGAPGDGAGGVLEPFYEARNDFHALIDLAELRLATEREPQERRRLLSRIAELNEAGIEDLQAAFAAWGRVLAEEPGDEDAQK